MRALAFAACLVLPASPAARGADPAPTSGAAQAEIAAAEAQLAEETAAAIAAFRRFLDEHADSPEATAARFHLGSLIFEQARSQPPPHDLAAAAALLEQVVADVAAGRAGSFTQAAEAWFLLGWCRDGGDPAGAAAAWERVAALAPGTPLAASATFALGQQALDAGDWLSAATRFDAARGPDPAEPLWAQATYLAGWAHYEAAAYATAIERFSVLLPRDEPAAATLRGETVAFLALSLVGAAEQGASVEQRWAAVAALLPEVRRAEVRARLAELLDQLGRFDDAAAVRASEDRRRRRRR